MKISESISRCTLRSDPAGFENPRGLSVVWDYLIPAMPVAWLPLCSSHAARFDSFPYQQHQPVKISESISRCTLRSDPAGFGNPRGLSVVWEYLRPAVPVAWFHLRSSLKLKAWGLQLLHSRLATRDSHLTSVAPIYRA